MEVEAEEEEEEQQHGRVGLRMMLIDQNLRYRGTEKGLTAASTGW